jgi:hypothetical protein
MFLEIYPKKYAECSSNTVKARSSIGAGETNAAVAFLEYAGVASPYSGAPPHSNIFTSFPINGMLQGSTLG